MTTPGKAAKLVLGGLVLLFAFTALYVAAFHAPRVKGLDVGFVGSAPQATRAQSELDVAAAGSFDVRRYDTESQARAALLDTDVHGVLVPHGSQARVLVAEAFGVTPTQAVAGALRRAAAAFGMAAEVEDLRPLPASDSRGLSSLFTVVGALIPSVVFGVLLAMFGRALQARVRWTAVFAYALLAGLVVAFNVDVLVGALSGHFAGIAVVVGMFALAVGAVSHGLGHLGGPMAIAMVVVLLVLLGLSSAGGAVTYELEPGFFSAVSQLLPPGAALTAVRNVEYFDWAATTIPLLVLAAWSAVGLLLGLLGDRYGPHARKPDPGDIAGASR